ncbi:MAG: hypothetical protein HFI74_09105 [Lachnospiraceae bacterium]|nr:hypothetical protein [Lachnospiraceae bacterium]
MVDKITFMETLHSVQEIARTSANLMSREEIQSYFQGMELSEEQQEMIFQYLQTPQQETSEEQLSDPQIKAKKKTKKQEGEKKQAVYSAPFRMYLKEISTVSSLSKDEENRLYEHLLSGDESVIEELSNQWLKKVIRLAKTYVTPQALLEDLVQEGNMGLLVGLRQLLGKGIAPETGRLSKQQKEELELQLETCVKDGMETYRRELEGEENSQNSILAKVSLVYEAKKILAEENGTIPTVEELCEYTKISPEEILDILALHEQAERK